MSVVTERTSETDLTERVDKIITSETDRAKHDFDEFISARRIVITEQYRASQHQRFVAAFPLVSAVLKWIKRSR